MSTHKKPSDVRIEGDEYIFSGELARRLRKAAEKTGQTTDELISEALTEFIEKARAGRIVPFAS